MAFENDIKLTGDNYTIYVNQDDDDAVIDVFMAVSYTHLDVYKRQVLACVGSLISTRATPYRRTMTQ